MAKGQTFSEGDKKERWEIIASFPNYDDSIHCRSLAFSVYASNQSTPTPWQQRQTAGKGCFSKEEKERRAPPILSQADVV